MQNVMYEGMDMITHGLGTNALGFRAQVVHRAYNRTSGLGFAVHEATKKSGAMYNPKP